MGLYYKEDSGKYKIYSTVTDSVVHKNTWLTKEEAKAVLIDLAYKDFCEKVLKIDHTFPEGYVSHNGTINAGSSSKFNDWLCREIYNSDNAFSKLANKAKEVLRRLSAHLNDMEL